MKEVKEGTYIKGEESFNFNFYTDLPSEKKLSFVNSVVETVVSDNRYNYIIKDLIFDFFIIDVFTDIDTTEFFNSNYFVSDVEEFLENTNIVKIVKANAKEGLIKELNEAVDKSIEYRTGIHANPLNEALTSLINTFEEKLKDIDLDGMMEIANKLSGMTDDFTTENIVKAYASLNYNNTDKN